MGDVNGLYIPSIFIARALELGGHASIDPPAPAPPHCSAFAYNWKAPHSPNSLLQKKKISGRLTRLEKRVRSAKTKGVVLSPNERSSVKPDERSSVKPGEGSVKPRRRGVVLLKLY